MQEQPGQRQSLLSLAATRASLLPNKHANVQKAKKSEFHAFKVKPKKLDG
ncbi:MAG: hypothetical protein ACFNZS_01560 [Ottowia sp.]